MKKRYTYTYSRKSIVTITVTAPNDEAAQEEADLRLMKEHPEADSETDIEVEFFDLKDVEPDGTDRTED